MEEDEEDNLINHLILNEYLIKKKLGEGTFGKVYIASNTKTGEKFAAKIVSKNNCIILLFICYNIIGKK